MSPKKSTAKTKTTTGKKAAKPGTYAAILEAAAYAKKVGLKNYAR